MKNISLVPNIAILTALLAVGSVSHLFSGESPGSTGWINDNPEITFQSTSLVEVALVSSPQNDQFEDFVLEPFVPDAKNPGYRIVSGGLKQGANPFTDRTYKLLGVPEALNGLTLLQTKMGHKGAGGAKFVITLNVEKPAYLFVAIDERILEFWKEVGFPDWLKDFAPTSHRVFMDDLAMEEERPFKVVAKEIAAGEIRLGPQFSESRSISMFTMYFAFVRSGSQC